MFVVEIKIVDGPDGTVGRADGITWQILDVPRHGVLLLQEIRHQRTGRPLPMRVLVIWSVSKPAGDMSH